MKACILSTGNELIRGASKDTNSVWLSDRLGEAGIIVTMKSIIDDDLQAISGAIRQAADMCDLVFVTGGLGPTPDDLTRQALADAMDSELVLDTNCLKQIQEFFQRRGKTMADTNNVQAMIPKDAEAIPNTRGTAPGISATVGNAFVYVMPGVPHEMKEMFTRCIEEKLDGSGTVSISKTLKVYGMGESSLAATLGDLAAPSDDSITGITVSAGLISVRVTAYGNNRQEAETVLNGRIEAIVDKIGEYVISSGQDGGMAQALGEILNKIGATVATAESCTGGMIGEMITAVPGSSEYYLGGVVAYSNNVKIDLLGVDRGLIESKGAVSSEVAAAMASGARTRFGSDWAIATTGIAGPSGGSDEKSVGLVFGSIAGPEGTEVSKWELPGDRDLIRRRASLAALNLLRLKLLKS